MLDDLRPLMTESVAHWSEFSRNLHGRVQPTRTTLHYARITYVAGTVPAPGARDKMIHYRATLWLIDHPRAITVGDHFSLPDEAPDAPYEVAGVETRRVDGRTLQKVFLK